jgi:hypothetical protein
MARDKQRDTLQTIFSFFLGLMVLAFIGIGVNAFYQSPADKDAPQMQRLSRQQQAIEQRTPVNGVRSASDQAELDKIMSEQNALQDRQQAQMEVWTRNTSIVLILFATMVMAVSLVRSEQLHVISNGLLLGGLFTMVYGSGWVVFSGSSTVRFFVILFALAVSLGLGWLKFVRGRRAAVAGTPQGIAAGAGEPTAEIAGLAARVDALERRAAAAAAALGAQPEDREGD